MTVSTTAVVVPGAPTRTVLYDRRFRQTLTGIAEYYAGRAPELGTPLCIDLDGHTHWVDDLDIIEVPA